MISVASTPAGARVSVYDRDNKLVETNTTPFLASLPTKYREVLVLKDAEELSYEEIRAVLQLPITTLKIRVVRARAMLREIVESQGLTAAGMVLR